MVASTYIRNFPSWKCHCKQASLFLHRLEDQEVSLSQKHGELSERWQQSVQEIRIWCDDTQRKLDSMETSGSASSYDELCERKKELQVGQSRNILLSPADSVFMVDVETMHLFHRP